MDTKTYWEQAQEEEDREQEAYLAEYRRRREAKKQSGPFQKILASIRRCLMKKE